MGEGRNPQTGYNPWWKLRYKLVDVYEAESKSLFAIFISITQNKEGMDRYCKKQIKSFLQGRNVQ